MVFYGCHTDDLGGLGQRPVEDRPTPQGLTPAWIRRSVPNNQRLEIRLSGQNDLGPLGLCHLLDPRFNETGVRRFDGVVGHHYFQSTGLSTKPDQPSDHLRVGGGTQVRGTVKTDIRLDQHGVTKGDESLYPLRRI